MTQATVSAANPAGKTSKSTTSPKEKEEGDPGGSKSAARATKTDTEASVPTDLRRQYSVRTIDALNQFSKYTRHVVTDQLDLRCEFDLPRFKELAEHKQVPLSKHEDH